MVEVRMNGAILRLFGVDELLDSTCILLKSPSERIPKVLNVSIHSLYYCMYLQDMEKKIYHLSVFSLLVSRLSMFCPIRQYLLFWGAVISTLMALLLIYLCCKYCHWNV